MSKEKLIIPKADMLMGSMRSMGYSFQAAIADVIDNSISASAKNISVLFPSNPMDHQALGILDDGIGLSDKQLFEAMRYGSSCFEDIRDENDLGRFGLGLKSASLSQCRILTVVSICNNSISAYTWDYNLIKEKKQWYVLLLEQDEINKLPYVDLLTKLSSGTLVIWKDFDILSKSYDGQVYEALNSLKDVVAQHISLIFHRYLSRFQRKINIFVNNSLIKPLDPFLESNTKTTIRKEISIAIVDTHNREQFIKVRPFILPYLSDMTDKDKKLMGGVEDMRAKQGFYIYRNERLIIWGKWFGMTGRNELTKNARIRVDIPNALDDIWSIDIKKQVATIPRRIQNQLTKTVQDSLGISVTKEVHRGRQQKIDESIDYIWDRMECRDNTFYYKINRNNELFRFVMSKIDDSDVEYVNMLLTEIENNVPIQQIYIDKSNSCIAIEKNDHREEEIYQIAITMIDSARNSSSLPINQLVDNLMNSEPFCLHRNLKEKINQYFDNET